MGASPPVQLSGGRQHVVRRGEMLNSKSLHAIIRDGACIISKMPLGQNRLARFASPTLSEIRQESVDEITVIDRAVAIVIKISRKGIRIVGGV